MQAPLSSCSDFDSFDSLRAVWGPPRLFTPPLILSDRPAAVGEKRPAGRVIFRPHRLSPLLTSTSSATAVRIEYASARPAPPSSPIPLTGRTCANPGSFSHWDYRGGWEAAPLPFCALHDTIFLCFLQGPEWRPGWAGPRKATHGAHPVRDAAASPLLWTLRPGRGSGAGRNFCRKPSRAEDAPQNRAGSGAHEVFAPVGRPPARTLGCHATPPEAAHSNLPCFCIPNLVVCSTFFVVY